MPTLRGPHLDTPLTLLGSDRDALLRGEDGVLAPGEDARYLVTRAGAWSDVMGWLLTSGVGGLTAVLAGITVVVALVAFPLLRRAVP